MRTNLPPTAPDGELLVCTDTCELFLGAGTGLKQLAVHGSPYRYTEKLTRQDTQSSTAVPYHASTLTGFSAGTYRIDFSAVFGCTLETAHVTVRLMIDGVPLLPTDLFTRVHSASSRETLTITRDVLLTAGEHTFVIECWCEPSSAASPTLSMYSAVVRATRVA
jgi:hypothetical protein